MNKRFAAVILGLAVIALGATFVHATGKGAHEPLWAYGFLTPPAPGDRAVRQNPPARRGLRPNENPVEQTRIRHIDGSSAAFSLVDIRDGQNVIDTDMVPKTRINGNLFLAIEQARTEPIAGRIIEVPEDTEQAETYRNPHSGFVAYVPVGSIKKGKDLVETGGATIVNNEVVPGRTTACANCHGPDLMGDSEMPPIAGRSPSYMARQLFDMQRGTRNGAATQLIKPVVANLTEEDIVAITAYVASRVPRRIARPAAPQPVTIRPVIKTAQR